MQQQRQKKAPEAGARGVKEHSSGAWLILRCVCVCVCACTHFHCISGCHKLQCTAYADRTHLDMQARERLGLQLSTPAARQSNTQNAPKRGMPLSPRHTQDCARA